MPTNKAILVGISGVSSSGKTTLSRLLRDIFPGTFVLHEDDFYKTDQEIPIKNGVADWDCLEALDLPKLENALDHIRRTGASPLDLTSKEDKNSVGEVNIDSTLVDDLKLQATKWIGADVPPIAIVDGFLLYSRDMEAIRDLFDVKLFLWTDFHTAKSRREARHGYVTIEGFWEDPPGYVENVVWPNYVKEHAYLFTGHDVASRFDDQMVRSLNLHTMPKEAQDNLTACLKWAYATLDEALDLYVGQKT